MFDTVIDQLKAVRGETEVVVVKLGTVTALSGGKAQVKLYGDSAASTKLYQYIDGYIPEVNDKVALLPQGKTYIILGKITDATPVEKYATIDYVDTIAAGLLPIAYKNKLEDGSHTLTLSGANFLAGATEDINIGSASVQFAKIYSKEFYDNGARLRADGILVVSGGTTYSLLLSYASSTATLTPSADDTFALGTSSKKFKEAYLGLFRGKWKSGNSTERQISWNSSNALVPDSDTGVNLGSTSYRFGQVYAARFIGSLCYGSNTTTMGWASASVFQPSATNSIDLGASGKQFSKIYANEFYINGTKLDISGIEISKLTAKSGTYTRTLTMTASASGATILPSVNNAFELGSSTYALKEIFAGTFTGDLNGKILNGSQYNLAWDSSHNLIPSTTNYLSLGTSSKQYKNIYGQNLYANGTAVTSDKSLKEDIKELEEKHLAFFRCLRPVQFKYKDGESGRTHTGFIAQEVMDAIHEAGMTSQDMAVVVKDPESGLYYLRYEEIISVQTQVIQNMQKKVDSLEARIAKLEALLERSTQ
jgi:hypothetical protein